MNRATKFIVSTLGIILCIAGLDHGIFETLQGFTPTPGLLIQAIGPAQRFYPSGTEDAFTIIPNFFITGILAILVALAILVWSVWFIDRKNGPTVFILLCVVLFFVGGGVGQIAIFLPAWALATRIHKPLTWWRKVLPERVREVLARLWQVFLAIGTTSFLIGLFIAIVGYVPGVSANDTGRILAICWSFVFGGGLGVLLLAFVAGFAYDIQVSLKGEQNVTPHEQTLQVG